MATKPKRRTRKSLPLKTVDEVIEAFGGIEAFEALGYSTAQIGMWRSRKRFSDRVKPRILVEMQRRGIRVAPELVGLEAA